MLPLVLRASEDTEEVGEADEVNLGGNVGRESNASGQRLWVCVLITSGSRRRLDPEARDLQHSLPAVYLLSVEKHLPS